MAVQKHFHRDYALKSAKLNGVEAARGLAALLVVLVHVSSMLAAPKYLGEMPLAGLFKFAHAGVDFFFVLSGFIIFFIHADELGNSAQIKSYWRKRFIRIFPVYWLVLAGYGLLLVVSPTPTLIERNPQVVAAAIVLYPHSLGPIFGVAWSLSHEILFYLLFSTLFFSRKLGLIVLGLWAAMIGFNILTNTFTDHFWGGFVLRIFNAHFFLGMFVAYTLRRWPPVAPSLKQGPCYGRIFYAGCCVIGFLLFFGMGLYESWGPSMPGEWPPRHMAYAVGAAAMLYGLVALEQSGQLQVPALAVELGTASYSIYLLHTIIIMFLQQGLLFSRPYVQGHPTVIFLVFVLVAVYLSMLFSRWVEQPLLKYLRPARPSAFKVAA